jgi:hypothetical protein
MQFDKNRLRPRGHLISVGSTRSTSTRRLSLGLICVSGLLAVAGCGSAIKERSGSKPAGRSAPSEKLSVPTAGWSTDFSRHTVPLSQFLAGGPGKDGIPAIDTPAFANVSGTHFLQPKEPVIELSVGGAERAYPIQILIWHEIVNDNVGGVPVAVTFCPLCNTAIAFDRRVGDETLTFGTTGNLRNSDLVMYDRQTESWWQQFGGTGLVGRYAGERLRTLPARIVSWRQFARDHPRGSVLQRLTGGIARPYGENPYAGYDSVSSPPFFPAAHANDRRLLPKERVVFVERGDDSVAIPFSALARSRVIPFTVGGHALVATWQGGVASPLDSSAVAEGRDVGTVEVCESGKPVQFDQPFWFAVAAFRPNVRIIR